MRASAFVPAHITGFFQPVDHEDPLQAGSRGCGVVISKGVFTTVEVEGGEVDQITAHINGEEGPCPVTETAVREVLKRVEGPCRIRVFHELEVPMKYGFGTSAAGSLGAVLALNRALSLGMTLNQCGQIAHLSEVLNQTGLGDVIAECTGGAVLRTEPGAPSIGRTDRLLFTESVVAFLVGEERETKVALEEEGRKEVIGRIGRECLELFSQEPTLPRFLELSKRFAVETGLMDERVSSALQVLEEEGIRASMAMLGNALFTLTDEPEKVGALLDYAAITAEIDCTGPRTL
jgi:pantoate kinase